MSFLYYVISDIEEIKNLVFNIYFYIYINEKNSVKKGTRVVKRVRNFMFYNVKLIEVYFRVNNNNEFWLVI